jgi:hypothetical protein
MPPVVAYAFAAFPLDVAWVRTVAVSEVDFYVWAFYPHGLSPPASSFRTVK